jgi:hypothetical protein
LIGVPVFTPGFQRLNGESRSPSEHSPVLPPENHLGPFGEDLGAQLRIMAELLLGYAQADDDLRIVLWRPGHEASGELAYAVAILGFSSWTVSGSPKGDI